MRLRAVVILCAAFAVDAACAKVQCQYNTECGERARCVENRCVTDCYADRDCPAERPVCTANGECVEGARDASVEPDVVDASLPDVTVGPDVVASDVVLSPDVVAAQDVLTPTDLPPAMDRVAPQDIVTVDVQLPRDVPVARDAPVAPDVPIVRDVPERDGGASVAPGFYEYTAVRPETLVYPAAVAWHPSGAYALILSHNDGVFRFDAGTRAITRVASTATSLAWRFATFTPDGTRAVLLGNVGSGASRQGKIFFWDPLTSSLSERTSEALSGGGYESLAWAPDGRRGVLLASTQSVGAAAFRVFFVDAMGQRGAQVAAYGLVASTGCEDLDWITDGFGDPALAVVCGVNTAQIFTVTAIDGSPRVTQTLGAGAIGNVSRIASHPQGDLALAVGSSGQRLYRVRQGAWSAGFDAPTLIGVYGVTFSTSGQRALAFGGPGRVWEYRTDLFDRMEIFDVSIPGLNAPPYNQPSGASVRDIAWRPGCDEGLAVGGSSTVSGTSAFVAYFRVTNGRACGG